VVGQVAADEVDPERGENLLAQEPMRFDTSTDVADAVQTIGRTKNAGTHLGVACRPGHQSDGNGQASLATDVPERVGGRTDRESKAQRAAGRREEREQERGAHHG
jgi:hypothetical protein